MDLEVESVKVTKCVLTDPVVPKYFSTVSESEEITVSENTLVSENIPVSGNEPNLDLIPLFTPGLVEGSNTESLK